MKFAAAGNDKCIRRIGLFDAQRNIRFQLRHQPVSQLAGCHVLPFTTGKRAVVYQESHLQGRFIYFQQRQRIRVIGVANRLAYVDVLQTGNRDDVAGAGALLLYALQPGKAEQLLHPHLFHGTVPLHDRHLFVYVNLAAENASNADPAEKIVVVQECHLHLQRLFFICFGGRDVFDDDVKQRF